jgi:adenosylmethionine-8-amino-7-oxononanoate aminotransferase
MTMQTGDVGQLRRDAVEKIIFHATPKKWLRERGPWLLERGQGAFLYDADGREYLDAMAGGVRRASRTDCPVSSTQDP